MRPPIGLAEIVAFYGWRDAFLTDLASWERWMVLVRPPLERSFLYLGDRGPEPSRGLRVHHNLANELSGALAEISAAGCWDLVERHSGAYAFRAQRGGAKLSMHAFGAAVDFDAPMNQRGMPVSDTLLGGTDRGQQVVAIMERRGWTWGGHFPVPDAMHFQWGSGY